MATTSKRLERLIEATKTWPHDRQEAAADVLEQMARLTTTPYKLSLAERADLEEALIEARRGDFASDAEVARCLRDTSCESPIYAQGFGAAGWDLFLYCGP